MTHLWSCVSPKPFVLWTISTQHLLDNGLNFLNIDAKSWTTPIMTSSWRHQKCKNKKTRFSKPLLFQSDFTHRCIEIGLKPLQHGWKFIVWAFRKSTGKVKYLFPSWRKSRLKLTVFCKNCHENYKIYRSNFSDFGASSDLVNLKKGWKYCQKCP